MKTKKYEWRAAVFNQIFTTKYYHVRRYDLNEKTGKFRHTGMVLGRRGPGGNLGYTSRAKAEKIATELNKGA